MNEEIDTKILLTPCYYCGEKRTVNAFDNIRDESSIVITEHHKKDCQSMKLWKDCYGTKGTS